jgi:hypothetical protein
MKSPLEAYNLLLIKLQSKDFSGFFRIFQDVIRGVVLLTLEAVGTHTGQIHRNNNPDKIKGLTYEAFTLISSNKFRNQKPNQHSYWEIPLYQE